MLAIISGILLWTLIEYIIHRWLGHDRRFTRKNGFGREHVVHHATGGFSRAWKKVVFFALAAAILASLTVPLMGPATGLAFTSVVLAAYLVYEAIHRLMHISGGIGPYARMLRRHHFHHHFHDPKRNFGVSSPLWDIVFGTWARVPRTRPIVVPKKLVMRWLTGGDGAIHARFSRDYMID